MSCPASRRAAGRLPAAAAEHDHRNRAEHDSQILEGGLTPDVLEIEAELAPHVRDRLIISLVYLRPAGDAGPDALAPLIPLDLLAQVHEDRRLLRAWADDVHLAPEHVDELRQLVQPQRAEHPADRGHARIVRLRPDLRVGS